MNYYIDTEFLEGTQKEKFPISLFRKETKPTIDLISIGIVSEDGREYYAISKDFNLEEAWNRYQLEYVQVDCGRSKQNVRVYWLRKNVLLPIWRELFFKLNMEYEKLSNKQTDDFYKDIMKGEYDKHFNYKSLQSKINRYGKTKKEIAKEVKEFTHFWNDLDSLKINTVKQPIITKFYAYYADYDWVAFCWLFGKMIDLPKGFPKYCYDLKQLIDDKRVKNSKGKLVGLQFMKKHPNYPKQENEHNALSDAKWNKKLHEFLNSF